MTAWQDQQPPQSRRQLRLSEQRSDANDDGVAGVSPEEQPVDVRVHDLQADTVETPVPHIETFARPDWEAPARRSAAHEGQAPQGPQAQGPQAQGPQAQGPQAQGPQAQGQQPRSRAEANGRRAQHGFPQAVPVAPDVMDVAQRSTTTQDPSAPGHSSQVPGYSGPSFGAGAGTGTDAAAPSRTAGPDARRPRRGDDRAADRDAPRVNDAPPAYRVRDFSPESRRSAFSSTSELSPSDWNRPGAAGESANLDYHTQQRPGRHPGPEEAHDDRAPLANPVQANPVQTNPVLTSPVLTSPVLTSPVHVSPAVVASPVAVSPAPDSVSAMPVVGQEPQEPQHPQAEHTLTRRELRALREGSAAVIEEPVGEAPVAEEPVAEDATDAIADESHADQAVTLDSLFAQPEAQQPEVAQPEPQQSEPQQQEAQQQETQQQEADQPEPQRPGAGSAQVPPPLQTPAASAPEPTRELSQVMAEFDSLMASDPGDASTGDEAAAAPSAFEQPAFEQPAFEQRTFGQPGSAAPAAVGDDNTPVAGQGDLGQPHERTVDSDSGDADKVFTVPTGHWSTQGALDDAQLDGVTLSRNVAVTGGAVTASHLVIASVPTVNDLLLPFSPTGEIMITGTIDLPRSLGSTGAHPARYDHSDVDALLEASDREDSNVDSAPVRAIRAVSTHTSSGGLIGSAKPPRSSRLPMVLAISTAAVAAVVVVLFVTGLMLHMF